MITDRSLVVADLYLDMRQHAAVQSGLILAVNRPGNRSVFGARPSYARGAVVGENLGMTGRDTPSMRLRSALMRLRSAFVSAVALAVLAASLLSTASAAGTAGAVPSLSFPSNLGLNRIVVDDGDLVLTGDGNGTGSGSCVEVVVNPLRLSVEHIVEPFCDDPALLGETVAPFSKGDGLGNATAQIAVLGPKGEVRLGPVFARYQENSGTGLRYAYGAGSLWVYEEGTANGPDLFCFSSVTGQLLQTTAAPELVRPILVADDAGVYLVAAGSFGGIGDGIIWYAARGAESARLVVSRPGFIGFARWAYAFGVDVWADLCNRPIGANCEIWHFHGSTLTPVSHVSDDGSADWVPGMRSSAIYSSENGKLVPVNATGAVSSAVLGQYFTDLETAQALVIDHNLYLLDDEGARSTPTLLEIPL